MMRPNKNQYKCNYCKIVRTILPKFQKDIPRDSWLCKKCRGNLFKQIHFYIRKKNNIFFPTDKHNAIEKFLAMECLVKNELQKQKSLKPLLKNFGVSKGIITRNIDGKIETSGDCDLIIFEKEKGKYKSFGEIVSIFDKKCVKAIISICANINDFKKDGQIEALKRQKQYCQNVFVIGCYGTKDSKDNTIKKITKKVKRMKEKYISLLEKNNGEDFEKLVNRLRRILNKKGYE